MKQVEQPKIIGLNATEFAGIGEQPEFITSDQLAKMQGQPPLMQPQPISDIPDLHKTEEIPTRIRRSEINQQVDATIKKSENIDDRISADLEKSQQKYSSMPIDPLETLKSLIKKGEYTKDFELFGHIWTLRALDQSDIMLSYEDVNDLIETAASRYASMMFSYVVYSIEALDGTSIYKWFPDITLDMFKGDKAEYMIAVKRALRRYLEPQPPIVIESLYQKYLEVDALRNEALIELKNS